MIGAIVQARMSSERLPGKVLAPLGGKPMLGWLLEGLSHAAALDRVVVATSIHPTDAPVVDYCRAHGVPVCSGPLDDVAGRFLAVLDPHPFDAFVRVSADSPLLDHRLVDRGVSLFLEQDVDVATNVLVRTFPTGQSVEVVSSGTFADAYPRMRDADDREHVTRYFYRHADEFEIASFESGHPWGSIRMSVDSPEDLALIESLVGAMERPHWGYGVGEMVELYECVSGRSGDGRDRGSDVSATGGRSEGAVGP